MKKPMLLSCLMVAFYSLTAQNDTLQYTISGLSCTKSVIEQSKSARFSFKLENTGTDTLDAWYFSTCFINAYWSKNAVYDSDDKWITYFEPGDIAPGATLTLTGSLFMPVQLDTGLYYLLVRSEVGDCFAGELGENQLLSLPIRVRNYTGIACTADIASGNLSFGNYQPDGSYQFLTHKNNAFYAFRIDTTGNTTAIDLPAWPEKIKYTIDNGTIKGKNTLGVVVSETTIPTALISTYSKILTAEKVGSDFILAAFKNPPFYPTVNAPNTANLDLTIIRCDQALNIISTKSYSTKNESSPSLLALDSTHFTLGYGTAIELVNGYLIVLNLDLEETWKTTTYTYTALGSGYNPASPALTQWPGGGYSFNTWQRSSYLPQFESAGNGVQYVRYDNGKFISDFEFYTSTTQSNSFANQSWYTYAYRNLPDQVAIRANANGTDNTGQMPQSYFDINHLQGPTVIWATDTFSYNLYPFREILHLGSKYYVLNETSDARITLTPLSCDNNIPVGSIEQELVEQNIRVFPNPAHSQIRVSGIYGQYHLALYSINGTLISQQISMSDGLSEWLLPDVPAGLYLLTVRTSQGIKTIKLLIE